MVFSRKAILGLPSAAPAGMLMRQRERITDAPCSQGLEAIQELFTVHGLDAMLVRFMGVALPCRLSGTIDHFDGKDRSARGTDRPD
jgi:hypothetical protein